jgi:predicted DNA repair protein MutK
LERVNRREKMEKDFEREVLDRLKAIEVKIDDYNKLKDKSEEAYVKSNQNEKDIREIQDKITWITRTIAGTIIGIVIGAIVFVLKMM